MGSDDEARLRARRRVSPELPTVEETHRSSSTRKKPRFHCQLCEITFKTNGFLARHMLLHSKKKVRFCDPSEGSESEDHCEGRPKSPVVKGRFDCEECGKSFNQKINLTCHMRVHTGERPYACTECEAAFKQKSALDNHKRIHTGEMPFPCRVCKARFRQRSALDVHSRRHTNERPYCCDQCDASYHQKSGLNAHKLKHIAKRTPEKRGRKPGSTKNPARGPRRKNSPQKSTPAVRALRSTDKRSKKLIRQAHAEIPKETHESL